MRPSDNKAPGIDPQSVPTGAGCAPYNRESFDRIGVLEAWRKYGDTLGWGRGQCLAILDDGCDTSQPAWQVKGKVAATYNSIDGNADCAPVPPGYHGTTVGYPSSMDLDGVRGLAYGNRVAQVRCVTVVHLRQDESQSMAAGLRWVADNARRLDITAVNLSPLDDQAHQEPVPTAIDAELERLRRLHIWVSAPAGNNHHTHGISWPACQPACMGIGATRPESHEAYLDRYGNIDLLVCAQATSSSNAYAAAGAQVLREAIEKSGYRWQANGETLPEAMLAIFKRTGGAVHDEATGLTFKELNLLAALDWVLDSG